MADYFKPIRTFSADEGDPSSGVGGPDYIENDLDAINTMFDPDALHDDGVTAGGIATENIQADAIDKTLIAADIAGDGLSQAAGGEIDVNVDDSTIEIDTDTLQIKDSGVSTAKIANDAVDKDKIAADVAGDGLGQAGTGALEVNVDDSTIEINSDTLRVKDDGIVKEKIGADVAGDGLGQNVDGSLEVNVDDSTIETNADTLRVKDDGITAAKINADVAGDGLSQAGSGALDVSVDDSTIEINSDTLRVKDNGITTAKIEDLTADRALQTDGSGELEVSAVTSTELGYLDGVTSAVQTQFDEQKGEGLTEAFRKWNYLHNTNTHDDLYFQTEGNWTSGAGTQSADSTNVIWGDYSLKILENDASAGTLYSDLNGITLDLTKTINGNTSLNERYYQTYILCLRC
jgi:DUF971 family protein